MPEMNIDPLIAVLNRFEEEQRKYADWGAQDTEPCGKWHHALGCAAFGLPYPDSLSTPGDWQLFRSVSGVEEAAVALTAAAKHAHGEISRWRQEAPAGQWRLMNQYLADYCWRVGWYLG